MFGYLLMLFFQRQQCPHRNCTHTQKRKQGKRETYISMVWQMSASSYWYRSDFSGCCCCFPEGRVLSLPPCCCAMSIVFWLRAAVDLPTPRFWIGARTHARTHTNPRRSRFSARCSTVSTSRHDRNRRYTTSKSARTVVGNHPSPNPESSAS